MITKLVMVSIATEKDAPSQFQLPRKGVVEKEWVVKNQQAQTSADCIFGIPDEIKHIKTLPFKSLTESNYDKPYRTSLKILNMQPYTDVVQGQQYIISEMRLNKQKIASTLQVVVFCEQHNIPQCKVSTPANKFPARRGKGAIKVADQQRWFEVVSSANEFASKSVRTTRFSSNAEVSSQTGKP